VNADGQRHVHWHPGALITRVPLLRQFVAEQISKGVSHRDPLTSREVNKSLSKIDLPTGESTGTQTTDGIVLRLARTTIETTIIRTKWNVTVWTWKTENIPRKISMMKRRRSVPVNVGGHEQLKIPFPRFVQVPPLIPKSTRCRRARNYGLMTHMDWMYKHRTVSRRCYLDEEKV
jgi:hypothetical protein